MPCRLSFCTRCFMERFGTPRCCAASFPCSALPRVFLFCETAVRLAPLCLSLALLGMVSVPSLAHAAHEGGGRPATALKASGKTGAEPGTPVRPSVAKKGAKPKKASSGSRHGKAANALHGQTSRARHDKAMGTSNGKAGYVPWQSGWCKPWQGYRTARDNSGQETCACCTGRPEKDNGRARSRKGCSRFLPGESTVRQEPGGRRDGSGHDSDARLACNGHSGKSKGCGSLSGRCGPWP